MVKTYTEPILELDIPDDWDLISLGKCVKERLSYGVNAPAVPYNNNYPCYVRITDITADGQYDGGDKRSVITNEAEKYTLKQGDIVLARTGASTGKSYLYNEKDGKLVYAGFLIKASVDTDRHNSRFIVAQLRTKRYWNWVSATSMRSGQPGINGKEYAMFLLPIAPKSEQDEIADILISLDTYIDDLAELIKKKKGIREGALIDLISGKTKINGFSGERKEYSINDITREVITGGTPSTSRREYYGGNIPWLASTEIHQKRITKPTTYITELGLQNSSAKIAPEKSVLIALAGQGKTRGTAAYLTKPMALNQSLAALVTNEKCNSEFLYYLIESMYLPLRELSSGDGGRGGLNKKIIKGVLVTIPVDVDEQRAIANTLFAMDEEIRDIETEREKIIQIREGAMDDLLTGRIRLTK